MSKILSTISPAADILLTIVAVLVGVGFVALLIFGVIRDRKRFIEDGKSQAVLSNNQFKNFVNTKIEKSHGKKEFCLVKVEVDGYDKIKKSIGDTQYSFFKKELFNRMVKSYGVGTRLTEINDGTFIACVRYENNFEDIDHIASSILKNLTEKVSFSVTLVIDVNVNLALTSYPLGGKSYDELISNLDIALLKSHRTGLNTYVVYNESLKNMQTAEYQYYEEIKKAIDNKNFVLFFMPCINLTTGEVVNAEALMRWDHPEKGIIPPSEFLGIMEQTGDIIWVGHWCFEQLAKEFANWQKAHPDHRFSININISIKELTVPNLVENVKKVCRKTGVLPENFYFEVNCHDFISQYDLIKDNLIKLKQAGFKIAIDGYDMNLSVIKRVLDLQVDMIKYNVGEIAKSFDTFFLQDAIKMLVNICSNHKIMLIAERVEEKEQVDTIKNLKIEYASGFYFSKPKNSGEFISDVVMTPWQADLLTKEKAKTKTVK